jgi:hypothetical protein
VAAPEHSPPDQQGATCILVLGHMLAEGRQHRESLAAGALGAKLLRNIAIPIIRPKRGQGAD